MSNQIQWPENCQFGKGLDSFTVIANRELLRRQLGLVDARPMIVRNRVRLSSDANGRMWTSENGG